MIGFDIDASRIDELKRGFDRTREVTDAEFAVAKRLAIPPTFKACRPAMSTIVTVPTASELRSLHEEQSIAGD